MTIIKVIAVVVIIFFIYFCFPLVKVIGDSMYPTYHDGEFILARTFFLSRGLKHGDVVVFYDPQNGKILIKRIKKVMKKNEKYFLWVLGDNQKCSRDSRAFGWVHSSMVICKVINAREEFYGYKKTNG